LRSDLPTDYSLPVQTISLGIDIGGTTVKAAATQGDTVLWTRRSARYVRPTGEQLADAIRQACAQIEHPIARVGLCAPGLLDEARERVIIATNMPGLVGVRLRDLIEPVTGALEARPIVVNDANATAFDVYFVRRPAGRLLLIAIGTGVGMAVLDDGIPLFVEGESPGHIGQIDVSIEGDPVIGPDGGRGGLEGYLGSGALRSRYGPDPPSKIRVGDTAFRALARAIRICHAIYRPHHVCLAGGAGIRLAHLVEPLRAAIQMDLTAIARANWTLFTGDSDFHAAAGAARIAAGGTWPLHFKREPS
jgi:glucokinase